MRKFLIVGITAFMLAVMSGCLPNGNNGNNGNGPPPPPPQRVMSILWMGDEQWVELMRGVSDSAIQSFQRSIGEQWSVAYKGTHIVGFCERANPGWYDDDHPIKLIMYFKTDDIDYIRSEVRKWKDDPNNGGYWLISGHEPDITGGDMNIAGSVEAHKELRRAQYKAIREEDPDKWNHPVVTFYNMTSTFAHYPGWQLAFVGDDHDIFVIDCYPVRCDGTVDYPGMEDGARLVEIGKARSQGQFIPNLDACYKQDCRPGPVVDQWEWWKERFPEITAVCYWNSGIGTTAIGVYEDEYLQEQVREVNRSLGLLNKEAK